MTSTMKDVRNSMWRKSILLLNHERHLRMLVGCRLFCWLVAIQRMHREERLMSCCERKMEIAFHFRSLEHA